MKHSLYLLFFCLFLVSQLRAQVQVSGIIVNEHNGDFVPFAIVKTSTSGVFQSDIDGRFSIGNAPSRGIEIVVSHLGFEPVNVSLPSLERDTQIIIKIIPAQGLLNEVVIKPPYEKIRYIVNNTVGNRSKHNPELYRQYRCQIYYKMIGDIVLGDSLKSLEQNDSFPLKNSHAFISETFTNRYYKSPQAMQDEVLATRVSGWNKAPFAGLVTDVLPFGIYRDFVNVNGRNFINPVSVGWQQRYRFNLEDEIVRAEDTLYILSFKTKNTTANNCFTNGSLYISSQDFAVTHFTGYYRDSYLHQTILVEQKYQKVNAKWFPHQLNYEIVWDKLFPADRNKPGTDKGMTLKGVSYIDSVAFELPQNYRFNKARNVILLPQANAVLEDAWQKYRPMPLNDKESHTYTFIDSLLGEAGIDKALPMIDKLVYGYLPVGIFDIDLKRLYAFNAYEKSRFGIGVQTNEKLLRNLSIGGWLGYGTGDGKWKFGGFATWYLDKFKDSWVSAGYQQDLSDPGRLQIYKNLDKNYLQMYLMKRVDLVQGYYLKTNVRLGYTELDFVIQQQRITPQYQYALTYKAESLQQFDDRNLSLGVRYAFGERRAPAFERYAVSTLSRYPVAFLRLNAGIISGGSDYTASYVQALAALQWTRQINRFGLLKLMAVGGLSYSQEPLPLSKMFSGRGFYNSRIHLYMFGGFMTMNPYDYYSDRFGSFFVAYENTKPIFSIMQVSKPRLSLHHNYLIGSMKHRQQQLYAPFFTAENGYHESGLMLQDLIRLKYLNMFYFNLNAGYFYHWHSTLDFNRNGTYVFGFSVNF